MHAKPATITLISGKIVEIFTYFLSVMLTVTNMLKAINKVLKQALACVRHRDVRVPRIFAFHCNGKGVLPR